MPTDQNDFGRHTAFSPLCMSVSVFVARQISNGLTFKGLIDTIQLTKSYVWTVSVVTFVCQSSRSQEKTVLFWKVHEIGKSFQRRERKKQTLGNLKITY